MTTFARTALTVMLCLLAVPVAAQTAVTTLIGRVVDQQGAAVPGVAITVHQVSTSTIWSATSDGEGREVRLITHVNDELFAQLNFTKPGSVSYAGAQGTLVQMWILKPPGFDPARKYPLVFLVHGGPQGAWMDSWSYRWNPQLWAAQGYVVALPNPRGSTGFGQRFVDEITHN